MKTAIYARVSTEEQAREGYSIDAQESRLKEFANSQGWTVSEMYIDDGYSAKNLERPAMKRMIRDIEKGNVNVVLVYKLDRLVRSVSDLHELLKLFDKHEVKFRSATEMFDTTSAMGRFFITLVGAMAQWEREQIAERVYFGMEEKLKNGGRNGGPAPFGYTFTEDGGLIKDKKEGELLLRIFEMHKNLSLRSVAIKLNKAGLTNRNKRWYYSTLQYIIKNPVYLGKLRWNNEIVDGDHEPYVTEELFNELENIRSTRYIERSKTTNEYIYTGILRCGRCGSRMIGTGSARKRNYIKSYKCMSRSLHGDCDLKALHESKIDDALFDCFWDIEKFKGLFKLPVIPTGDKSEVESEVKQIHKELDSIKSRKKRWHLAYADGAIELSELDEYLKDDKERESELKERLNTLDSSDESTSVWTVDNITEQLSSLKTIWPNITDVHAKREFLQRLFSSITVSDSPGRYNIIPEITQIIPK